MAEKASKRITSGGRSCNSKRCTAGEVRVVHISNPTIMVETTASEFCGVVQSLTGKRSSPSISEHEDIYWYSDYEYGPHELKAPEMLEEEFQCLKSSESAIFYDSVAVSNFCNDTEHCDVRIFEELEVLPIQTPHYIASHEVSETLESIGDRNHIFFDKFSPSFFSSEFQYL